MVESRGMEVERRAGYPWCSLTSTKLADEAKVYATARQSIPDIRIVPLPESHDVLTGIVRVGARDMLAKAVEAEVAAWIENHARLKDDRRRQTRIGTSVSTMTYSMFLS